MIQNECQRVGPLKPFAERVVAFAKLHSPESEFTATNSGEWALYPDNWITLKFIYTRKDALHISLGIFPVDIQACGQEHGVTIKSGKFPNWCKISVYPKDDQESAFRVIEFAYLHAFNTYRANHPKPRYLWKG